MKKNKHSNYLFLGILLIGLFLAGCKNLENQSNKKTGTIRITINAPLDRIITSTDSAKAAGSTNGYEVLIYNDTTVLSTLLDPSNNSATLSVETGVYTVLILAGDCTATEGILLGSGFQELVTVEENIITEVSIMLTSISHSFSVPVSVTCTQNYEISVSGNTNNQLLQISSGGTTMDNKPYIEIGENTSNIYLTCLVPNSSWSGTITLAAPAFAEQTNIKFFGSNVKIVDPVYSIDDDIENIGSLNWLWLNNSSIPEAYTGEVNKNIEFVTADTGINIIIGWN